MSRWSAVRVKLATARQGALIMWLAWPQPFEKRAFALIHELFFPATISTYPFPGYIFVLIVPSIRFLFMQFQPRKSTFLASEVPWRLGLSFRVHVTLCDVPSTWHSLRFHTTNILPRGSCRTKSWLWRYRSKATTKHFRNDRFIPWNSDHPRNWGEERAKRC